MNREYASFGKLVEMIESEPLRLRAAGCLAYYLRAACFYKRLWLVLSVLNIVLPAVATFFICMNMDEYTTLFFCVDVGEPWVIPLITSVTTIASGLLALLKCDEKKLACRAAAERLKHEVTMYAARCGDYAGAHRDAVLCERVELVVWESFKRAAALEMPQTKPQ